MQIVTGDLDIEVFRIVSKLGMKASECRSIFRFVCPASKKIGVKANFIRGIAIPLFLLQGSQRQHS